MSRSGYSDDIDNWDLIRWRGAVSAAIKGRRGQALLRELAAAMDAMPVKRLISGELSLDGEYCALGVVGASRGLDLASIDPEDSESVAGKFDIAEALAKEIVYANDDCHWRETPEHRWERMRKWVESHINGGVACVPDSQ